MTIRDQIIHYLKTHPEGVDDDDLARILKVKYRQQVNSRCRQLQSECLVIRRYHQGKIHNFWAGKELPVEQFSTPKKLIPSESKYKDWFWEGNVQQKIIAHLLNNGFQIISSADTASNQRGVDVKVRKNGQELWITVKGYPRGTPRTNHSTQAGHWFKQAIFDIIAYRDMGEQLSLAVALPDFPRYRKLSQKITWIKPIANFDYYWVSETGEVQIE